MILALLVGLGVWETGSFVWQHADRGETFRQARQTADLLCKPLLNIGCMARLPWSHGCGDVCLDINAERLAVCQSRQPTPGDIRAIPFPDKTFGAAFCSHVLEHMHTVPDAEQALRELARVSDFVYVCSPNRMMPGGWVHPDHWLWVHHQPDGTLTFEQRDRGRS